MRNADLHYPQDLVHSDTLYMIKNGINLYRSKLEGYGVKACRKGISSEFFNTLTDKYANYVRKVAEYISNGIDSNKDFVKNKLTSKILINTG